MPPVPVPVKHSRYRLGPERWHSAERGSPGRRDRYQIRDSLGPGYAKGYILER